MYVTLLASLENNDVVLLGLKLLHVVLPSSGPWPPHRGRHAKIFGWAKSLCPPPVPFLPFTYSSLPLKSPRFPPLPSLSPLKIRPLKYS